MSSLKSYFKFYGLKGLKIVVILALVVAALFVIAPLLPSIFESWNKISDYALVFKYIMFVSIFAYWDELVNALFDGKKEYKEIKCLFFCVLVGIEGLYLWGRYL